MRRRPAAALTIAALAALSGCGGEEAAPSAAGSEPATAATTDATTDAATDATTAAAQAQPDPVDPPGAVVTVRDVEEVTGAQVRGEVDYIAEAYLGGVSVRQYDIGTGVAHAGGPDNHAISVHVTPDGDAAAYWADMIKPIVEDKGFTKVPGIGDEAWTDAGTMIAFRKRGVAVDITFLPGDRPPAPGVDRYLVELAKRAAARV